MTAASDPGPVGLRSTTPFRCASCVEHWRASSAVRVLAHRLRGLVVQLEARLARAQREVMEHERQRGLSQLGDAPCGAGGCPSTAVAVLHVDDGPPLYACQACTADWALAGEPAHRLVVDERDALRTLLEAQGQLLRRVNELAPSAVARAAEQAEAGGGP